MSEILITLGYDKYWVLSRHQTIIQANDDENIIQGLTYKNFQLPDIPNYVFFRKIAWRAPGLISAFLTDNFTCPRPDHCLPDWQFYLPLTWSLPYSGTSILTNWAVSSEPVLPSF